MATEAAALPGSCQKTRHAPGLQRALRLFAAVAISYAIGSELSWQAFGATVGMAFFPAAGVTAAAMLLNRRRFWPVVVLAIASVEMAVDLQHGLSLAAASGYAAANSVEPLAGAAVVLWLCAGRPDLRVRRDFSRFFAGACVFGPLLGGVSGATVGWLSSDSGWLEGALQWWAGDGVAVLVIATPILLWSRRRELVASRRAELALLVVMTAALSVLTSLAGVPQTMILLPLLAWAAFRLGDIGVVVAGAVFACGENYLTAAGQGEFARLSLPNADARSLVQAYVAVVVIVGLLMAQEISGRLGALEERQKARAERDRANARRAAAELGTMIADATSVAGVADLVVVAVRNRLGADQAALNVLGEGEHFIRRAAASGPVMVTDTAAVATMPLLTDTGAQGYLDVWWSGQHEVTLAERDYLEAVAELTGRGMERARRHQAEQRERRHMQALADLTRLLSAALTPQDIGRVVSSQLRRDAAADGVLLGVTSEECADVEWISAVGLPGRGRREFRSVPVSASTPATDAIRTGEPVIIRTHEEYKDRYPGSARFALMPGAASVLDWPLTAGDKPFGVLGLKWTRVQPFDESQLAFAAAAASLVAQALVRARKFADEHVIAATLQDAVMPKVTAAIDGLDLGACYQPAGSGRGVGGDWYDAMPLPDGGIYLAVGDVVGHGLTAAEDMTQLRNAGRALAIQGLPPGRLLGDLSHVARHATHGQFATMGVAILDPVSHLVSYASAGQPPMLLRRAKGGGVRQLPCAGGPALGAFDPVTYTQQETTLERDDVLIMYTDGLVESRGKGIDSGIARLERRVGRWSAGKPLAPLCRQVTAALAPQPHDDDVCLLAVAVRQKTRASSSSAGTTRT